MTAYKPGGEASVGDRSIEFSIKMHWDGYSTNDILLMYKCYYLHIKIRLLFQTALLKSTLRNGYVVTQGQRKKINMAS